MRSHDEDDLIIVEASRPRSSHRGLKASEDTVPAADRCRLFSNEWNELFGEASYLSIVRNAAFAGDLKSCHFRSICWKACLHCLPEDRSRWLEESQAFRTQYEKIKLKILIDPRTGTKSVDSLVNNPLSQEESSPWNRYFLDAELKLTINQDVIRTFPEIEFFQSSEVREIMVNVLFCYAREHPQTSYRQGMHELLAPLVFVLHSDQQAFLQVKKADFANFLDIHQKNTLKYLLDGAYLEHDAYCMFCSMMSHVEAWYLMRDASPSKCSLLNTRPFARPQDANACNIIISKLTYIHDLLLRRSDHDLYIHLEKMEIAPQIYGIRWLRLLFGREFSLQDLLVVWDVIFADGSHFGLVDYVFISMLVYIRTSLLAGDYATCLGYLMRYPTVANVHHIIDLALHLRDPKNHPKPTISNRHAQCQITAVGSKPDVRKAPLAAKPGGRILSGMSSLKRKATNRPKCLMVSAGSTKGEGEGRFAPGAFRPIPAESVLVEKTDPKFHRITTELAKNGSAASPVPMDAETEMKPIRHGRAEKSTLPRCIDNDRQENLRPGNESRSEGGGSRDEDAAVVGSHKRNLTELACLQHRVHETQLMCSYCAEKMSHHIDSLQDCILKQHLENEDEMLIALAGMKQVRDVLTGTLKFNRNLVDGEEITQDDGHCRREKTERTMADRNRHGM